MTMRFEDLSVEGRLLKIRRHLETGHPVDAAWVRWLLVDVAHRDVAAGTDVRVDAPFAELDGDGRFEKIRRAIPEGKVPAPWVSWLLDRAVKPDRRTTAA